MKKIIVLFVCVWCSQISFSQSLEKGNVIGQHTGIIVLNPEVTYNQFKDFFLTKYIPEFNKIFNGELKIYLIQGERGTDKDGVSFLYVFKSVAMRDKYFPTEGSALDPALTAKLKSISDQLAKLGRYSEKSSTDWIVQ